METETTSKPKPFVLHADEGEWIEGRYRFVMDGVESEVGPGAVVYLPRDCVHSFQNIGDTPARHWALLTPSGFETFYARCAEVFAAPGPPDLARIAAITRGHGYQIFAPAK
jgi:hypothetical protein